MNTEGITLWNLMDVGIMDVPDGNGNSWNGNRCMKV